MISIVPSLRKYEKALTKIRNAAKEYSYLWKEPFLIHGLSILDLTKDESQRWRVSYEIKMGRGGLCFYGDGERMSIKELSKRIQDHAINGADILPERLVQDFVDAIEKPLMAYEIAKARIHEKVKEKIMDLEGRLSLD